MTDPELFDSVLTVGPDINGQGGMESVLQLYRKYMPVFHYRPSNSRFGTLAGAFRLLAVLTMMPIDRLRGRRILHLHGASDRSYPRKSILIHWGHLLGYKIIYHSHGCDLHEYFAKRDLNVVRRPLDKCSEIIVLSEWWKNYFAETFGYTNIDILYNIVDIPAKPLPTTSDKCLNLLFMGEIGQRKGIFDLLRVMAANRDRWIGRVHLTVGGAGPDMKQFHSFIAQHSLKPMISYKGWVRGEAKEELFAACDVIILPSHNEGLPIFILEGMASGRAIISTPVGGIPEVVTTGLNGFLVTPGNDAEIAQAIQHYIDHPEHKSNHGQASLDRIAPYKPDSVMQQLSAIYRKLMSKGSV